MTTKDAAEKAAALEAAITAALDAFRADAETPPPSPGPIEPTPKNGRTMADGRAEAERRFGKRS